MTFSLLGRSPRTGAFGGIVASSAFASGGWAMCGKADQGLVISQGYADSRLGAAGVAALAPPDGSAMAAVAAMRRQAGPQAAWRQLAALDAAGRPACFTGEHSPAPAGEAFGPDCVALGSAVGSQRVLLDMVAMFATGADDPFGDTLIEVLVAGARAGGDRFPLQSAALRIYQPDLPFAYADLRIDFSPHPLTDLRVLWSLWVSAADGYVERALHPELAPEEGALEGHRIGGR